MFHPHLFSPRPPNTNLPTRPGRRPKAGGGGVLVVVFILFFWVCGVCGCDSGSSISNPANPPRTGSNVQQRLLHWVFAFSFCLGFCVFPSQSLGPYIFNIEHKVSFVFINRLRQVHFVTTHPSVFFFLIPPPTLILPPSPAQAAQPKQQEVGFCCGGVWFWVGFGSRCMLGFGSICTHFMSKCNMTLSCRNHLRDDCLRVSFGRIQTFFCFLFFFWGSAFSKTATKQSQAPRIVLSNHAKFNTNAPIPKSHPSTFPHPHPKPAQPAGPKQPEGVGVRVFGWYMVLGFQWLMGLVLQKSIMSITLVSTSMISPSWPPPVQAEVGVDSFWFFLLLGSCVFPNLSTCRPAFISKNCRRAPIW